MKTLSLFLALLLFVCSVGRAAERVALVIGNGTYQSGSSLPNPVPDAQLVAARLTALGFAVTDIATCTDLSKRDFNRRLTAFATAAQGAEVALFYFAGHGVMGAGDRQYLLPVDVVLEQEADFATEAIAADDIITALSQTQVKAKVLILDCCRNNPFAQDTRLTRTWLSRDSTGGGLAAIQAELPQGTAVMFSAAPGKKAKDGPPGGNSPFATALCATLGRAGSDGKTPDTIFNTMLGVSEAVETATSTIIDGKLVKQEPYLKFDGKPQLLARLSFSSARPIDTGAISKVIQIKLPGDVIMKFCYCPAGSFTMGSPASEVDRYGCEQQVNVRLSQPFWMGRTEVTQGQWKAMMGTTPAQQKAKGNSYGEVNGLGAEHPMYFVSAEDADAFVAKLNSQVSVAGWRWALPTDAQWEYACRAGTESVFSFGDVLNGKQANCDGNYPYGTTTKGPYLQKTCEVGSYVANAWGLCDMHGNVREWCVESWGATVNLLGGTDPLSTAGAFRLNRGGSWRNEATYCRAAYRDDSELGLRSNALGFRPALVPAK